jgi:hypothetical protein
VITNYRELDPVDSADIIHYAYGYGVWDKRHYYSTRSAAKVWNPPAGVPAGTIFGEDGLANPRSKRVLYQGINLLHQSNG